MQAIIRAFPSIPRVEPRFTSPQTTYMSTWSRSCVQNFLRPPTEAIERVAHRYYSLPEHRSRGRQESWAAGRILCKIPKILDRPKHYCGTVQTCEPRTTTAIHVCIKLALGATWRLPEYWCKPVQILCIRTIKAGGPTITAWPFRQMSTSGI